MLKGDNWLRDLIFAAILIALIKEIIIPYVRISLQTPPQTTEETRFHDIGEEGRALVAEAGTLSERINELLDSVADLGTHAIERLKQMKHELRELIALYTKDSPGSVFLGPLGSTAVVLKERKLKEKLMGLLDEFEQIQNTPKTPYYQNHPE